MSEIKRIGPGGDGLTTELPGTSTGEVTGKNALGTTGVSLRNTLQGKPVQATGLPMTVYGTMQAIAAGLGQELATPFEDLNDFFEDYLRTVAEDEAAGLPCRHCGEVHGVQDTAAKLAEVMAESLADTLEAEISKLRTANAAVAATALTGMEYATAMVAGLPVLIVRRRKA